MKEAVSKGPFPTPNTPIANPPPSSGGFSRRPHPRRRPTPVRRRPGLEQRRRPPQHVLRRAQPEVLLILHLSSIWGGGGGFSPCVPPTVREKNPVPLFWGRPFFLFPERHFLERIKGAFLAHREGEHLRDSLPIAVHPPSSAASLPHAGGRGGGNPGGNPQCARAMPLEGEIRAAGLITQARQGRSGAQGERRARGFPANQPSNIGRDHEETHTHTQY
jgi:hypothetical protein